MSFLAIKREILFFLSKRSVALLLVVSSMLSIFAVWTGSTEVNQQRETIEHLVKANKIDQEEVINQKSDYGSIAYYTFNLTYDAPSDLAFSALGSRDSISWKHRIKATALEGQIHESDTANPEMAMVGRIDFNFIISILAPIIVILLLHDLKASERFSGRFDLLSVTDKTINSIWKTRILACIILVAFALLIPFWVACVINGALSSKALIISLMTVAHISLWAIICYWFSKYDASSSHLASGLLGLWLTCTFIIPVAANVTIERLVKSPQGGEILMAQRDAVNSGREVPIEVTMDEFTQLYPQWKNYTHMDSLFDWKWYFAFNHLSDQKVAALSTEYRNQVEQKYTAAGWVSWISPSTLLSRTMTRLANTDPIAAWQYQDRVRAYHAQLRRYFYPYLFNPPEFDITELEQIPSYPLTK
ncbi:MAG: DUF3526 domain-containing protein [Pseudoalteromonas sp.]|uniref:DUF3526 domain-containing protein n=1 Tax=Pseudoalteromonas nigrifaciens TaxID=28109 RepID=UPI003FB78833